jgi:hypothetical protein
LSFGTLQLSIRCSSIHFLPSRSLPVSVAGGSTTSGGWLTRGPSCAAAGSARQAARNAATVPLYNDRIDDLAELVVGGRRNQLNNGRIHLATRNLRLPNRFPVRADAQVRVGAKEEQMNTKQLILAGCAIAVLSISNAMAGPCDTSRTANLKDAGSGPASMGSGQTTGMASDTKEHAATSKMNRAADDVATSSQDTQKQMQGQPTAAQQAQGAKPDEQTADKACD